MRLWTVSFIVLMFSSPVWGQDPPILDLFNDEQHQWTERLFSNRDDTVPGVVTVLPPTLQNLAVQWIIEGDNNLNSVVQVRYRVAGATGWKNAMPLRRVPSQIFRQTLSGKPVSFTGYTWPDQHSGSILDLEPGTSYEIMLSLSDPDGGSAERTVTARTRPIPVAMAGVPVKVANPGNLKEVAAAARPGDIITLTPGNYGYFAVPCDGEPGKPIVFRKEPDSRFVQQTTHRGDALFMGISLQGRKHVYLEYLVSQGTVDLFNAEDCVIRQCRIFAAFGITSCYSGNLAGKWSPEVAARFNPPIDNKLFVYMDGSQKAIPPHAKNCLITDNLVVGMTEWAADVFAVAGRNIGEGIEINGPGNVICNNTVTGFRDCISIMESEYTYEQNCIDIYNNDITFGADDAIEVDYMMSNCRVMRNRITNCHRGIAGGVGLGGPNYIVRNVMYNLVTHAIAVGRVPAGHVVLHNTTVKTGSAAEMSTQSFTLYRNNLWIGGPRDADGGRSSTRTPYSVTTPVFLRSWDIDYNGYGLTTSGFRARLGEQEFTSLDTWRSATTDKHAVVVGLDIFAEPVVLPNPFLRQWPAPDLRLRAGSAAIDAGEALPNINDGFTGKAPDLGAYELGQELPVYGRRNPGE